jgi:O-antigen/teichoic acid export membrane protein
MPRLATIAMKNAFDRSQVVRSVLLITGSTYVTYACGLLVSTMIARTLGPADYGRYSYLVWMSGILMIFLTSGMTASAIRFVSESLGRGDAMAASSLHGWLQRRYRWSSALVAVAFCVGMSFFQPTSWSGSLWIFTGAVLICALAKAQYMFRASVAKGYGLFGVEATTTNIMSILGLVGAVVLTVAHASLNAYLVLFVGVCIGHAVVTQILMRRANLHPSHEAVAPVEEQRIYRYIGWTIVLTVAATFANKSTETLLLEKWAGPEAVGFFLIATALTRGGIDMLCSGLVSVLMPAMSHAFGTGGIERVNRVLADAVRYLGFLGLLLAGVGVLWASPIIFIMYGPRFEPAIFVLQAMLLVGGLTITDGVFGAVLSTTDNQNLRAIALMLYVVVTAIMAIALVPTYGLHGAVWAHVLSRSIACTAIAATVVFMFKIQLPYAELARLLAAAGCGALVAALVLLVSSGIIAQGIAGILYAITYTGATLLLRVWHPRDLGMVGMVTNRVPMLHGVQGWLQIWVRSPIPGNTPE